MRCAVSSRLLWRRHFSDELHTRRLLVLVQVGLERERFAAALARERLQIGMGLDVGPQVGLVRERLLAYLARERLLP